MLTSADVWRASRACACRGGARQPRLAAAVAAIVLGGFRPMRSRAAQPGKEGVMKWMLIVALCASTAGCGLAAAPCRVASAGLKIVPLVGHVAAAPTDACAGVIDPD
ncbi:hypothetical protein DP44_5806 [Burkholderia pseudomallei]|nr:hypothetical protein DP44_5806 [Burkholderia pseudomallei]